MIATKTIKHLSIKFDVYLWVTIIHLFTKFKNSMFKTVADKADMMVLMPMPMTPDNL